MEDKKFEHLDLNNLEVIDPKTELPVVRKKTRNEKKTEKTNYTLAEISKMFEKK